jgi:hypothetical protein
LKQRNVVSLETALKGAAGGKQSGAGLVVAVGVDGRHVLLLLDAVQVLKVEVVALLKKGKKALQ